jgi:hypothetical protein
MTQFAIYGGGVTSADWPMTDVGGGDWQFTNQFAYTVETVDYYFYMIDGLGNNETGPSFQLTCP